MDAATIADQGGETMGGGSSRGGELSPSGGSSEMITDGCPDANGEVLINGVAEHLLCHRPNRRALAARPSGSASMRRNESYQPVLLSHSRVRPWSRSATI